MDTAAVKHPKDKWIPRYFVMFFAVIAVLDGIFVYLAVSTQTGIVTEQPYEKGLAFNKTLEEARAQPDLEHQASYTEGILRWILPLEQASVTASIIRPVQDGYDFSVALKHVGNGVYEVKPELPFPGAWTAKLKATWDNQKFQTSYDFIAN